MNTNANGKIARRVVGFVHVVRGQEDRYFFPFRSDASRVPKLVAGLRVASKRGFVEEKNFRSVEKAASDFQTPFHPAGKCFHNIVPALPQLEKSLKPLMRSARTLRGTL
jgi:hypothetical protein